MHCKCEMVKKEGNGKIIFKSHVYTIKAQTDINVYVILFLAFVDLLICCVYK